MWAIPVLVIALALGLFGWRYATVRFGDRYYIVGRLCAALAVALVILVITYSFADDVLDWAHGDRGWGDNGLVRTAFIIGIPVTMGLWAYVLYRRRNNDSV